MSPHFFNRKLHRYGALAIALPLGLVTITGLLLQVKKQSKWVQPPSARGIASVPTISFEQILAATRSAPQTAFQKQRTVNLLVAHCGKCLKRGRHGGSRRQPWGWWPPGRPSQGRPLGL